jgi:hypothetical protein
MERFFVYFLNISDSFQYMFKLCQVAGRIDLKHITKSKCTPFFFYYYFFLRSI